MLLTKEHQRQRLSSNVLSQSKAFSHLRPMYLWNGLFPEPFVLSRDEEGWFIFRNDGDMSSHLPSFSMAFILSFSCLQLYSLFQKIILTCLLQTISVYISYERYWISELLLKHCCSTILQQLFILMLLLHFISFISDFCCNPFDSCLIEQIILYIPMFTMCSFAKTKNICIMVN